MTSVSSTLIKMHLNYLLTTFFIKMKHVSNFRSGRLYETSFLNRRWYCVKYFQKRSCSKLMIFLCILEQFLALVKKNDNHTYAFLEIPHRGMENNHWSFWFKEIQKCSEPNCLASVISKPKQKTGMKWTKFLPNMR